jgi:polysaccharide pyruvyl transferase WcaK-like protein
VKRILLVGADQNNSRDGIITEGVRRILHSKYEDGGKEVRTTDYILIDDYALMPDSCLLPADKFDLIVYCGTPFLSDQIHLSPKWKNVERLRELHASVPFIFMGIGSSVNLSSMNSAFLRDDEHRQAFASFFGTAAITTVRDEFAQSVLADAGVASTLLPCPAYYVPVTQDSNKKGPALIFYDPRKGISQGDWKSEQKFIKYAAEFRDYYFNRDPDVYVASDDDVAGCIEIGLPTPKVLRTPEDLYKVIKEATFLLTGRVHNAIPAHMNDVLTVLLAVDSRAYTFYDFGGSVIFPGSPEMMFNQQVAPSWHAAGLAAYHQLLPEL